MKSLLSLCGVLLPCVPLLGAAPPVPRGAVEYRAEIEPYVSFLQQQKQGPVDYIMGLFRSHDIVILCERDHRETTQYDLFFELVSDPRFIAQVGSVFTEVGTSSVREEMLEFLCSENLSEKEVEKAALDIWRNLTWTPLWQKRNFFDFLRKLHSLNGSLSAAEKVKLYPSDMPFSWDGMTKKKYQAFRDRLGDRDRIMAKQITGELKKIATSGAKRKKALVIMNYRHAFNDRFKDARQGQGKDNVGRYLFEAHPGKVANVMINSFAFQKKSTDRRPVPKMIQDGRWDAAFEVAGNRNLGFDFADSPFGDDSFDYWPSSARGVKYQNVFTGFVFYGALEELVVAGGIPGVLDGGFDKVLIERYAIVGRPMRASRAKARIARMGRATTGTYKDRESGVSIDWTAKDSWLTGSRSRRTGTKKSQ